MIPNPFIVGWECLRAPPLWAEARFEGPRLSPMGWGLFPLSIPQKFSRASPGLGKFGEGEGGAIITMALNQTPCSRRNRTEKLLIPLLWAKMYSRY